MPNLKLSVETTGALGRVCVFKINRAGSKVAEENESS
jgi:hypothetical protein